MITVMVFPDWWHCCIACMPDNVPAIAVLRVACKVRDRVPPFPNWRRPWGRPPINWLHQICSDCGLSAGNALNCAQDRAVWRTYAMASSALRWRRLWWHCFGFHSVLWHIWTGNICPKGSLLGLTCQPCVSLETRPVTQKLCTYIAVCVVCGKNA